MASLGIQPALPSDSTYTYFFGCTDRELNDAFVLEATREMPPNGFTAQLVPECCGIWSQLLQSWSITTRKNTIFVTFKSSVQSPWETEHRLLPPEVTPLPFVQPR